LLNVTGTGRIISILAGALVFALLQLIFQLALPFALIGGVLGWLIVILIYSGRRNKETIVVEGLTRQDMEDTIKAGRNLTAGMRQAIKKLSQVEICLEVEDLCRIADSMFEMLKKDPKDIRIVKQFISHYLEPTHKIIIKYVELATVRPMPAGALETLGRTEKSLKGIRTTFLQQKEKMLNNDVLDLDTEIKVFETLSKNMETGPKKNEKSETNRSQDGTY